MRASRSPSQASAIRKERARRGKVKPVFFIGSGGIEPGEWDVRSVAGDGADGIGNECSAYGKDGRMQ